MKLKRDQENKMAAQERQNGKLEMTITDDAMISLGFRSIPKLPSFKVSLCFCMLISIPHFKFQIYRFKRKLFHLLFLLRIHQASPCKQNRSMKNQRMRCVHIFIYSNLLVSFFSNILSRFGVNRVLFDASVCQQPLNLVCQ